MNTFSKNWTRVLIINLRKGLLYLTALQVALYPLSSLSQGQFKEDWRKATLSESTQAVNLAQSVMFAADQELMVIDKASGRTTTYNLNSPNLTFNENVEFGSTRDLKLSLDQESGDLFIDLARGNRIYRHRIGGMGSFSSSISLKPGGSYAFLATREAGLLALPMHLAKSTLFKAFVPVFNVLPAPPGGGIISEITQFNLQGSEDQSRYLEGLEAKEVIFERDLGLTIQEDQGEGQPPKTRHLHLARQYVETQLHRQMIDFLAFMAVQERSESRDLTLVSILNRHRARLTEFWTRFAERVDSLIGEKQELVALAFQQYVRRGGSAALEAILAPHGHGHQDRFEASIHELRHGETVERLRQAWAQGEQTHFVPTAADIEDTRREVGSLEERDQEIQSAIARATVAMGERLASVRALGAKLQSMIKNKSVFIATAAITAGGVGVSVNTIPTFARAVDVASRQFNEAVYASADLFEVAALEIVAQGRLIYLSSPVIQGGMDKMTTFLGDKDVYSIITVAGVAAGLMALQPLAIFLSSLVKFKDGQDMNAAQKFFSIFIRYNAWLNGAVSGFWQGVMRQKLLYSLYDNKVDPLFTPRGDKGLDRFLPAGFHLPWTSEEIIQKRAEYVQTRIAQESKIKHYAEYLTALIVATQKTENDGGRPLSVFDLVTAEQLDEQLRVLEDLGVAKKAQNIEALLQHPSWRNLKEQLFPHVFRSLVKYVTTKPDQPLNEQAFQFYSARFSKLASRLRRIEQPTLVTYLQESYQGGKAWLTRNAIPYVLYGASWRNFSQTYRYVIVPKDVAKVAGEYAFPDYYISMFVASIVKFSSFENLGNLLVRPGLADYSLEAGKTTGAIVNIGPEQVALGGQGAIGAYKEGDSTATKLEEGMQARASSFYRANDPQLPRGLREADRAAARQLSLELFGEEILPENNNQGVHDAAHRLYKNFSLSAYMRNHASYIKRVAGASSLGNVLSTSPFLAIGFLFAGVMSGGLESLNLADLGGTAAMGFMSTIYLILVKYTFSGYAYLISYVHLITHEGAGYVAVNRNNLAMAANELEQGARTNDRATMLRGYHRSRKLFVEGKKQFPADLIVSDDQVDAKLALAVLKYQLENTPVATVENPFIFKWLTNRGLGAVGTTILYFQTYAGAFEVMDVVDKHGLAAGWSAFSDNVTWALAFILGTYAVLEYGPKLLAKDTYQKLGETTLRSYVASANAVTSWLGPHAKRRTATHRCLDIF